MLPPRFLRLAHSLTFICLTLLLGSGCSRGGGGEDARRPGFVGGMAEDVEALTRGAFPVRNAVHQGGDEIVTLRYWRIRKGTFAEFYSESLEGVWPYIEKIGARVIGMWQVIAPRGVGGNFENHPDYDEVYLATRYASVRHWQSTREAASMGGNGPDWVAFREALERRRELTISTYLTFLQGGMAPNGPYHMPGLNESYERTR